MPAFTYQGPDRYYPSLGLEVEHGTTAVFDEAPDSNWVTPETSEPAPEPATVQPTENQE